MMGIPLSLAQIRGMIYYEMLIHWRRGWLRVAIVTFIVVPSLLMLAIKDGLPGVPNSGLSRGYSVRAATDLAIFVTLGVLPMILITLPVLVAETIPLDHYFGVGDILRALPLRHTTYLTGKVLGVWVGIILSMVVSASVIGIIFWFMVGAFDLREWLNVWISGLLLFAFFSSAISILFAVSVPTRRRAVLVGFAMTPIFLAAFFKSPLSMYSVWVMTRSSAGVQGSDVMPELPPIQTPSSLALGIAGLALAWSIAWLALRSQEANG